jgi:hypothetical protein
MSGRVSIALVDFPSFSFGFDRVRHGSFALIRVTDGLHDYQSALGAACLLFVYMDFIQRAGELLQAKLGGQVRLRERMDTHPRASLRLDRLELTNLGEYLYTSPLERYSRQFFISVLDYASSLDDEALLQSVNGSLS